MKTEDEKLRLEAELSKLDQIESGLEKLEAEEVFLQVDLNEWIRKSDVRQIRGVFQTSKAGVRLAFLTLNQSLSVDRAFLDQTLTALNIELTDPEPQKPI